MPKNANISEEAMDQVCDTAVPVSLFRELANVISDTNTHLRNNNACFKSHLLSLGLVSQDPPSSEAITDEPLDSGPVLHYIKVLLLESGALVSTAIELSSRLETLFTVNSNKGSSMKDDWDAETPDYPEDSALMITMTSMTGKLSKGMEGVMDTIGDSVTRLGLGPIGEESPVYPQPFAQSGMIRVLMEKATDAKNNEETIQTVQCFAEEVQTWNGLVSMAYSDGIALLKNL